jgi:hypothetical protein
MSIGAADLGQALLWITGFLGVLAAGAALAVWLAKRRGSTTIVLDATRAIAQVWLVMAVAAAGFSVWRWTADPEASILGLPMTLSWPDPLPYEPTGAGPELVSGAVTRADVWVHGLSSGTRAVLATGDLLAIVIGVTPAVVLLVITRQALSGAPFTRTASRWLFIAAGVVLVAGISADLVSEIGKTLAAGEVLPGIESGAGVTTQGFFSLTVPLWPIGAALALAALGVVFRHGTVLQRDTEGLV